MLPLIWFDLIFSKSFFFEKDQAVYRKRGTHSVLPFGRQDC